MRPIRLGVIGYGYWGPNIVRNFLAQKGCAVVAVCDLRPEAIAEISHTYPAIGTTRDYQTILKDLSVDAVAIVTPVSTHFRIAQEALLASKHVLVEKPFTRTTSEAKILEKLAHATKKHLMVNHTFVYTPAIQTIRDIVATKTLGNIYYIDCVRTNLGLVQQDTNVIYDLATHDFAIIDYLMQKTPNTISATGFVYPNTGQESIAHINAWYRGGLFVHAHVSWLSPLKIRTMMIVGTKKMLFYDDMEPSEKIKIYDKSISIRTDPAAIEQLRIGYRTGSTLSPHVPLREGLSGVAQAFTLAIQRGISPPTDGRCGTRVVRIVEAASRSMKKNGKPIHLV